MNAILSDDFTSIQSLPWKQDGSRTVTIQHDQTGHAPIFTTGHDCGRNKSICRQRSTSKSAHFFTFLGTSLWLAAIGIDDSDTSDLVRHRLSTGW